MKIHEWGVRAGEERAFTYDLDIERLSKYVLYPFDHLFSLKRIDSGFKFFFLLQE